MLERIFSEDKIRQVEEEVELTQILSQEGARAIGDYASKKLMEANELDMQALTAEGEERAKLEAMAAELRSNWGEGGTLRVAMHTAIGALGGGIEGALGAAATAAAIPHLAEVLKDSGISEGSREVILLVASAGIGQATNGTGGMLNSLGQTVNNYLTHEQRDQASQELAGCGLSKSCIDDVVARYLKLSKLQDEELAGICANGLTNACKQALNEAAWYVNEGTDGWSTQYWNLYLTKEEAMSEKSRGAKAFADSVFNDSFNKDNFSDAFVNGITYGPSEDDHMTGLEQRQHMFGTLEQYYADQGHEVEWFGAAESVSGGKWLFDLESADGRGLLDVLTPDDQEWLEDAGYTILSVSYDAFRGLYERKSAVTGDDATLWDKEFVIKEQTALQPIHEKYLAPYTATSIPDYLLRGGYLNPAKSTLLTVENVFTGDNSLIDFMIIEDRIKYGCNQLDHKCVPEQ